MDNKLRNSMPAQKPEERIKNFEEVALGFTEDLAYLEASRCLNCKNAPCMNGCPVNVKIPMFIQKIKEKDLEGAAAIIGQDNNLPAICGRVCPQENQCENFCVRKEKLGGSVSIGYLERFVADYALSLDKKPAEIKKIGKKVAIVGAGPAGLSCASDLAKAGVDVTIFEALHEAGGVLIYGIPEFRLPKELVKKEIANIKALGVKIKTNVVIGKSLFIDELLDKYDSVFIGSGAGLPMFLRIPGENLNGVYSANEYLTRVNLMKAFKEDAITPILHGKKVIVVGAGNVAMDSARTARRLGAEVHVVYRRSRQEMPARKEEIAHAEEEGIILDMLNNPVEIIGEEGHVKAVKCIKMVLGEPDESGRRSPVPVEGSEFTVEADEVIVALGTTPNPIIKNSMPSLETTKKGTLVADENGKTNIDRLYCGGDVQTGAATVILAMGAGKKAAKAILNDLTK